MQVGDLVELSAYGKKGKGWQWLHGSHGIVTKHVNELSWWKIHWFGKLTNVMKRKEIKHVKAKKLLDNIF